MGIVALKAFALFNRTVHNRAGNNPLFLMARIAEFAYAVADEFLALRGVGVVAGGAEPKLHRLVDVLSGDYPGRLWMAFKAEGPCVPYGKGTQGPSALNAIQ